VCSPAALSSLSLPDALPICIDADLLAAGEWVATAVSPIRGFHLSSLYSPWVELRALVVEFVEATKTRSREGLMEFINLKLGEPRSEEHTSELQSRENLVCRL